MMNVHKLLEQIYLIYAVLYQTHAYLQINANVAVQGNAFIWEQKPVVVMDNVNLTSVLAMIKCNARYV